MLKGAKLSTLLAFVALGCSGTETGNPGKSTAALELDGHSTNPEVVLGPDAAGVRIESAWLRVATLAQTACDSGRVDVLARDLAVDLLAQDQDLPELQLAEPALCALELSLAAAEQDPSTIVLSGLRGDDAPFVIASPALLAITLQPPAPLESTSHEALLLSFDVSLWLEGTDLAGVALDTDGVARIDGSLHPATVMTFNARIAPSAGLYPDFDADGDLDPDEQQAPLAGH
jgi:hypothetical protein